MKIRVADIVCDASELLESSRAAVLTRSVDPGTQLQFRVNGPDAYVILFMGDRPGKEGPRATENKSLYLEWSRTDIGGEQKEPRPLNNISEKSKSVWKEAVLLCVDVVSLRRGGALLERRILYPALF
ncbi:hypothetical protein IscW_ISCW005655 [Ixodes scapularis]|uniref:Uncharacterized protein n=1 Tax=Ixodes scapularis TaxID=6945 RepID=B7PKJ9_IXOSC|nr:hypothetical protein IscW_ISCW005655 [Ixodes scapularis]|eukprot:XP_002400615.1 hypothetical protein IscW_ISCW005655 [Ixodes scapularis]